MALRPGIDLTKMFTGSFYASKSQKCKKTVKSSVAFGMCTRAKATRKMLVKFRPDYYLDVAAPVDDETIALGHVAQLSTIEQFVWQNVPKS